MDNALRKIIHSGSREFSGVTVAFNRSAWTATRVNRLSRMPVASAQVMTWRVSSSSRRKLSEWTAFLSTLMERLADRLDLESAPFAVDFDREQDGLIATLRLPAERLGV